MSTKKTTFSDSYIRGFLMPTLRVFSATLRKGQIENELTLRKDEVPALSVSLPSLPERLATFSSIEDEDGKEKPVLLISLRGNENEEWVVPLKKTADSLNLILRILRIFGKGYPNRPYLTAEEADLSQETAAGEEVLPEEGFAVMPRINALSAILSSFEPEELLAFSGRIPVIWYAEDHYAFCLCYEAVPEEDAFLLHLRADILADLPEENLERVVEDFNRNHDHARLFTGLAAPKLCGEGSFLTLCMTVFEDGEMESEEDYERIISDFEDTYDQVLNMVYGSE